MIKSWRIATKRNEYIDGKARRKETSRKTVGEMLKWMLER
jgi:hypothetical protein